MRTLLVVLLVSLSLSVAFACDKCGHDKCCCRPDWGYSYNNAEFMPDCAPRALSCFQNALIPMIEARKSGESAYIREHACELYQMAERVKDHPPECDGCEVKHYKRAAKDLVKDCDRLKEIVFGGTSHSLYEQMEVVENDFIRLSNLIDD
jgi:hypothetical protein